MNIKTGIILLMVLIVFGAKPVMATEITCPTIADIKNNQLNGWLMLYEDTEEQAQDQDAEKFKQSVTYFEAAKWNPYYLESAHCFYALTQSDGKNIILAHDAFGPVQSIDWVWTPKTQATCTANEALCRFMS